jgi:hypothetical protein
METTDFVHPTYPAVISLPPEPGETPQTTKSRLRRARATAAGSAATGSAATGSAAQGAGRNSGHWRYGGEPFAAASQLPLQGGLGHPRRVAMLLAAALAHPRRAGALIGLIANTKSEQLALSGSAAGQSLREYFAATYLGVIPQNRLCRGVLLIPPCYSEYIRGRRRQALRTNLRRAERAGIRCERVDEPDSFLTATRQVMESRQTPPTDVERAHLEHDWAALVARPEMTLLAARDADGRPQAALAAIVDDHVGLIQIAVACGYDARWALHDHLLKSLCARGTELLMVEGGGTFGALGFSHDVHHFQHLLGYELRHVRLAPN